MNGNDTTIIIPAAGLGRRMKSYGPKALIEVAPRQTILSRQLVILGARFPQADIIVVVGFESERIIKSLPAGIRIVENECYETTNVARSISLALRCTACKRALIVYGDLVFTSVLFKDMPLERSFIVVDNDGQMRDFEVGVNVVNEQATFFSYGLDTKWCQIALLTGRELELFRKLAAGREKRRHFGYEVLNEVLDGGGRIRVLRPDDMKIVEVDTSKDIEQARQIDNSTVKVN